MNGPVHEWIEKAEGDFQSAQRELRARKAPNYDAACYAANIRYPGESATRDEARAAVKAMRTVRAFVRSKLGLSDE